MYHPIAKKLGKVKKRPNTFSKLTLPISIHDQEGGTEDRALGRRRKG